MKITRKQDTRLPIQNPIQPARKDAGVQSPAKPGISISPMARHLQQLLASQEPFDTQKVEKLKQLMAKGEYGVDVTTLTDKLMDEILRKTEQ